MWWAWGLGRVRFGVGRVNGWGVGDGGLGKGVNGAMGWNVTK